MKPTTSKTAMVVAFVVMIGMTGIVAATTVTYDSSVTLDNKVESNAWALTPCDDIGAVIEYNFASDNFEWSASGTVPASNAGDDYSLIYYADTWPGNNPGAFIGTITTDSNGDFTASGSTSLGMDLPCAPDDNIAPDPDYCDYNNGFDDYVHCCGAKLWMVPSADYDATNSKMTAYTPANYLFETDLINYTRDAGISIGYALSCEGDTTPITIPIVVSNADNVGSVDLTMTYDSSLVSVTVAQGDMDDFAYVICTDQVQILANQKLNPGLNGTFNLAEVTFTPSATATGTSDFDITVTTFADATYETTTMPYVTRAGAYHIHAYMNGDVNDNGVVDSGDVMVMAKHLVGICGFETINECAADVNGDGDVDSSDLMYLAKYLLGYATFDPLK